MISKQIAALKTKSLARWQKIAVSGVSVFTLLSADECGYCAIYCNSCDACPLFRRSLCDDGGGRAYRTVYLLRGALRARDNSHIDESKKAAAVMVAAIERDIARDAKKWH